jgi:hypothetical protein
MSVTDTSGPARGVSAGVDWAKDDYAVCVVDGDGAPVAGTTLTYTQAGLRRLVELLDRHGVDAVGIERPDGPIIDVLLAAGRTVYGVPPSQVKALRRRYGSAGNKDDRFDAYVLASQNSCWTSKAERAGRWPDGHRCARTLTERATQGWTNE